MKRFSTYGTAWLNCRTTTWPALAILLWSALGFSLSATAAETVVLEWHNDKGLAGTQVRTIDGQHETLVTELGWNNRRVKLEEHYQLDNQGFITKLDIKGVSAFGAPVDESFEFSDGNANWTSRADDGRQRQPKPAFYLAVDGFDGDLLVRALKQQPDKTLPLLPSGQAKLKKLNEITVSENGDTQRLDLLAIIGVGLEPQIAWYDQQGRLFALNIGGFFKGIRKGWSMDTFDKLKVLADQAQNQYFADLTRSLTQTVPDSLLIKNVHIVDVESKKLLKHHQLWLQNGKIAGVGKALNVKQATVMDGKGQYVIPGLWDMHGHVDKTSPFTYLPAGVTSVRDIGNSPDNIKEVESLYDQSLLGVHLFKAGFIDKQSDYSAGNGFTVNSLQEAKDAVDWYADNGYIQIKTYSSMDPKWVPELAKHIHSKGMRLSGHIPAFMTAQQAVEAGFDEIQHINMLFLNFLASDKVDTRKRLRFSLVGEQAHSLDLNSKEVQEFITMLADKGIEVDATVSTFLSLLLTRDKQIDQEYADIAAHLPPSLQRGMKTATMKIDSDAMDKQYQASAKALLKMTKLLFDKGVPLIPGTDMFTGFTLQRELALYSQAGIPNIEVLKLATLGSAKVVGADKTTGSISTGKQADLVLLQDNPLEDMTALRSATLVMRGTRMYEPAAIHQALGIKPFVAPKATTVMR